MLQTALTAEVLKNLKILGKSREWINTDENIWNYGKFNPLFPNEEERLRAMPFIDYVLEDKSKYPLACNSINPRTNKNWVDPDDDFRIGLSGGLLMNIDFIFVNTSAFTHVADYYTEHKEYCPYDVEDKNYKIFWRRETERRRKGIEARSKVYFKDVEEYFDPKTSEIKKKQLRHYVRITGDHYDYLNYGRIERTPNPEERKRLDLEGRIAVETLPGFPRFWDADYWFFKTDEFVIRNKKNLCLAKARRKGVSYKRGSAIASTVNLNKAVTIVLAADIIDYLTDPEATSDMAKKNLDWYETQTYWKRGYLSEALDSIELGYKKSKEGNKKYGFQSKVISVAIGRNDSAAIGKKGIGIDFEEAGKSQNLQNAWNVTLNNIESGAIKIGTGRMYGTAGTKNANWTAFSNIFYNPDSNNMITFENVWNYNARHKTCGFFIPQIWCCEPFIWDGNSLFMSAWEWDKIDKIRQQKTAKPKDYIIYCAQRANSPAEAFIDTKDNLFSSTHLNNHIQFLYDSPLAKVYSDGWYVEHETGNLIRVGDGAVKETRVEFVNRQRCINEDVFKNGGKFHDYIEDVPHNANTDVHGCVRELIPPYVGSDGKVPEGLYFAVADTYRIDKDMDQVDIKNSLYSVQVYMYSNNLTPYSGKRLVAEYCGRLDKMSENDRVALNFCKRYNCGILPEAGTGEIISNFKVWGEYSKIMKDPSYYGDRSVKAPQNLGDGVVVGDGEKKLEGLRMLYDHLYEVVALTENKEKVYRLNETYSLAFCLELQRYNLSDNFDRISTAIVAMFEFRKKYVLLKEATGSDNSKKEVPMSQRMKRKFLYR